MRHDFSRRACDYELIDGGPENYTQDEYFACLRQLGRIGSILGGDRATLNAFDKLEMEPRSILDVGCGGGHFTLKLAQKYPKAKVVGIDTSKWAIDYANKLKIDAGLPNLSFEHRVNPKLDDPKNSYDIVTCTLVCHHLDTSNLVDFLRRADTIATHGIILNDLHRHPLAYYSFCFLAPLAFNNRLICHDGPLSVLRSFKQKDWIENLKNANINLDRAEINWRWAFRWIVTVKK